MKYLQLPPNQRTYFLVMVNPFWSLVGPYEPEIRRTVPLEPGTAPSGQPCYRAYIRELDLLVISFKEDA